MPDGWSHLEDVDLAQELNTRIRTTKAVPRCLRDDYLRIMVQCLVAVESSQVALDRGTGDEAACVRAWKLFLLLPRMLLHATKHGGEAGERELRRRIHKFDAADWGSLLDLARQTVPSQPARRPITEDSRIERASNLVKLGELSHAARELQAQPLAPGNAATPQKPTNPNLSASSPSEPLLASLDCF